MRSKKTKEHDNSSKTKAVEPSPKKPGPPPIELNYSALDAMLQFKISKKYVCNYLKISEETLDRRLKRDHDMSFTEYHELKLQRTSKILQEKAVELALSGKSYVMLIFCLKNIAKWSDDPIDDTLANRPINISYNIVKNKKEITNDQA